MLLPADVVAASPAPFADAMVSRWGQGGISFAALAIAISAFGCLNGLILATGELGYAMALRGDLPAGMAKTRGINTPVVAQIVASGLTILLLLANSSRATANLFTFIILLSTAAVIVLYSTSALAAWKLSPTLGARVVIAIGLLFIAFATMGSASKPVFGAWCCSPVDSQSAPSCAGSIRRRLQPGDGGRSSRASGISRRSFCAKLRRQTSLVPNGPAI